MSWLGNESRHCANIHSSSCECTSDVVSTWWRGTRAVSTFALVRSLVGRYSAVGIATRCGRGGPVRGSNPCGSETFHTLLDRLWGPPSLLYNGHPVSFPGIKRSGRGIDHSPPSSAENKERVELYLYSLNVPLWLVLVLTLSLPGQIS